MKRWKIYCFGLVALAGLTPSVLAQPALPAAAAPAAPAAAAGPPQPALLNMLGLGPDQLAACKDKICASCIGQALLGFTKITSGLSGGCLPPCCPPVPFPVPPPGTPGAAGEAAKIAAILAKCKGEMEALRYLANVDCIYFPAAGAAMAGALRESPCECVRLEAARALATGCCCNRVTIKALAICVAGSEADGNPRERSERVRASAYFALEHCLACVGAPTEAPEPPREIPPETPRERREGVPPAEPKPGEVSQNKVSAKLAVYSRHTDPEMGKIIADARRVIDQSDFAQGAVTAVGSHGLFDIVNHAMDSHPRSEGMVESEGGVTDDAPRPHGLIGSVKNAIAARHAVQEMPAGVETTTDPAETNPPSIATVPAPALPSNPPATLTVYPKTEMGSGAPGSPTSYTIYPMGVPSAPAPAPMPTVAAPTVAAPTVSAAPSAPAPAPRRLEPVPQIVNRPAPAAPAPKVERMPTIITPKIESTPVPTPGPQTSAPAPVQPVVHFEPARPVVQSGLPSQYTQQQLMVVLRNSSYPWQREWAVENLASADARTSPEVVQLVLNSAQHDAAASVRLSAIHCLVRMNVHTLAFVNVLQSLRADSDSRVRHEAEQVLQDLAHPHMPLASQPAAGFTPAGN